MKDPATRTKQLPSVGRIVHYRTGRAEHLVVPLLITEVHSDLCVSGIISSANPYFHGIQPTVSGASPVEQVLYGPGLHAWSWPPFMAPKVIHDD